MSKTRIVSALFLILAIAAAAGAVDIKERWVYVSSNLLVDKNVDDVTAIMAQAKAAGCTHVLLADYKSGFLGDMPENYFRNVQKVRDAARADGLIIIPAVFSIGYSGNILYHDPNLAEGIPVKDAPFIVRRNEASADPSAVPAVANAGFDNSGANRFSGWRMQDFPGQVTFADPRVKRSGDASLRMEHFDLIPRTEGGHARLMQTIRVEPFQYYHLTIWIKTDNLRADETKVLLTSHAGKRTHSFTDLAVRPTQDWTMHELTFNTFDATEINLYVGLWGARSGTIWWDELRIEPAGLANVLRRDLTPLAVTSADGKTTYVEGKDYLPVSDEKMLAGRGDYDVWHTPPVIRLAPDSRIRDGQRLLVSFYHPALIYDGQVTCSIEDPKVLKIMDDQMKRMAQTWQAPGYFMSYDEIRVGGWERQVGGERLTPGQLLARHVAQAGVIVNRYAPKAEMYVWSDMFDPYHNARALDESFYYLVNGSWQGSWEGLPRQIIICNWNGGKNAEKSLKFFAGMERRQIIAGYYDGPPAQNVDMWLKSAQYVRGVIGIMYTTWQHDYKGLDGFFKLVSAWPAEPKR